jgi:hypothetical protein
MSIQIKLKNSVVQDSTPSTSDLPAVGEIALNANINSIGGFMRASDNSIVKIFGPGSLSTPTATTTVSGISELATSAETTTGTATNRVVTPAGLNAVTVAERTTSNTNYVAKAGSTMTGVLTATAGSNSAPAINFGDSDSGIFGGTNTVSLAAGGTTRLTADTGVDITGTLAVTGAITSTSDLTVAEKVIHAGDTDTFVSFPAANTVSVETGGSEAIRVDSSQRLLVGTSSSRAVAGSTARSFQIEGTAGESAISVVRNSSNTSGSSINFGKSRSSSVGGNTIVQSGDVLGAITFAGADGTDIQTKATEIRGEVDGTPGANDMPGRLVFGTTADGAATPTTRLTIDSAGLVKLPDNGKFVAGAGNDLQIYHDGSNSYIKDDGAGAVILQTNKLEIKNTAAGEDLAKFTQNAAVELYYDNSKKFETAADRVNVYGHLFILGGNNLYIQNGFTDSTSRIRNSGGSNDSNLEFLVKDAGTETEALEITSSSHIRIPNDNKKLKFGAGDDLEIYHDGSDSYIKDVGTGQLLILTNEFRLQNAAGNEQQIAANENGAVELFYDGSKKFDTLSDGARVTGRLVVTENYEADDNKKITLGNSQDLQLYHDGTNSIINHTLGSGALRVQANDVRLMNNAGNEHFFVGFANDYAGLYFDNSQKLKTNTNGVHITDTLTFANTGDSITLADNQNVSFGNGGDLKIFHSGSHSQIVHSGTGNVFLDSIGGSVNLRAGNNAGGVHSSVVCNLDAGVELYFNNSKKFETTADGISVTGKIMPSANNTHNIGSASLRFVNLFMSNAIDMGDGATIQFGDGDDLKILHNGSHSIINNSTGSLQIQDGGNEKFRVSGTGTSFKDSIFIANDSDAINLGASNDLQIYHDGTNSVIAAVNTGDLQIFCNSDDILLQAVDNIFIKPQNGESGITVLGNSGVELFFDNVKKLKTISEGVKVTELQIAPSGTESGALVNFAGGGCSTNADSYSYFLERATAGSNTNAFTFRSGASQTHVGTINFNNTQTMYNTTSDYRLKENAVSISDGITRLKTLKPYRFNFKGETDIVDGFFAHEVTPAVPEAISGTKDEVDSKGNPVLQGIDQSKLVPLLVAAVQELIGRVEKLEAA